MLNLNDLLNTTKNTDESDPICVVRLSTSIWSDERGIQIRKTIRYVHKLSNGFNILQDTVSAVGAENHSIIDLYSHEDGLYEVLPCNEKRDYETGAIDSYDLRLFKYIKD